jgi:integrase/recombinase XerC
MTVTIFRRHLRTCPHFGTARGRVDRCGCPFYADARPHGGVRSLETKDRSKALAMARDMELSGGGNPSRETIDGPMKIKDAKEAFFVNLTVRNLSAATKYKHDILWRQCLAFAEKNRLEFVADLDATVIDRFVKSWKDAALARGKKLERFRQFFKFAVSRKWIEDDPTAGMKGPIVKQKQTPPFTPNEMAKILVEAEKRIREAKTSARANAFRAKALILFLRFSGLRIIDAVGCQIEWVKGGRVRLITRKTGVHIDVEMPPHVTNALAAIPPASDLYFFWTGNGAIETATKDWQKKLANIFDGAGINDGHAHRFRDTFAVAMLESGKSLQAVADALGNSLQVTQRHYNPWSKIRQSQLDVAVRGTWKDDPLLRILDDQEEAAKLAARGIM